ncbi:MAG: hypothetical protein IJX53_06275 [Clostridia bacterium]|nr:hypothetical protein [Clostridia bacterium]
MKKISIIVSAVLAVGLAALIPATSGAILHISVASVVPLAAVVFILYFSLTDLRFADSGREMLHTSDADIPYAERVVLYRYRGLTYVVAAVPEVFLIFCLPDLAKILLAVLVLMLGLGAACIAGAWSIRKMAAARYAEEEAERKRQLEREARGVWKKDDFIN